MHNSATALFSSICTTVWPHAPQAPLNLRAADPVAAGGSRQALLLDAALDDLHVLAAGAGAGMAVAQFGGGADGLAQLLAWAATAENYDALHIVCHGEPGRLQLGARALDRAALEDPAVQDALRAIGLSLRDGGSVLLYSCNVAQGEQGAAFVADLALALGAPVAAARGLVGAATLGGSWNLDFSSAHIAASALAWPDYAYTLQYLQTTTTFSTIPANTNYASLPSTYPSPSVLSVNNIATSGWDVVAQANNAIGNNKSFLVRGINSSNNGDGDTTSIRFEGYDMDYITFRSNEGYFFDLTSFSFRNAALSDFTVQALDASGATTGTAVAFSNIPAGNPGSTTPFNVISLAGNTDFLGIYGFKITLTTGSDAPNFDNLVVANIGLPPDTTPPAKPGAPDLRIADDTGSSGTDNITSVNTPIFTGTAEAGSTVRLYDSDGTTLLGSAVATGGNWSITSSTLAEGSHTLTVKATDAAGNVSVASDSLVVVIDRTAPTTVALSSQSATTSTAAANAAVATLSSSDVTAVT
ncbi:MAG: DUF4347 domain-containing protein, partial [Duganella sp.]